MVLVLQNNIILIGMMGSWKTTIGRLISKKFGLKFVDIDHLIEAETGHTIAELFEKYGEEKFRSIETETLKSAFQGKNCVISTGGGTILSEDNRELLRMNGRTILLRARADTLASRIRYTANRPILSGKNDKEKVLADILEDRKDLYESTADFIIDTDDLTPEGIAKKIEMIMRKI